jgi:hypothetical protein
MPTGSCKSTNGPASQPAAEWGKRTPTLYDLRERVKSYETFAGLIVDTATLTEPIRGARSVAHGFVDLFRSGGRRPLIGRTFAASDDRVEAPPVVVLSEGLWARKFGRDSNLVGKPIILDGKAYTVSGIVPQLGEAVSLPPKPSCRWACPGTQRCSSAAGITPTCATLALLRPGITRDQAEREAAAIYADSKSNIPTPTAALVP